MMESLTAEVYEAAMEIIKEVKGQLLFKVLLVCTQC